MSDWYTEDTEAQPDGFVGGDGACESVSVRFYHTEEPARLTVYMYVVDTDERGTYNDDGFPFAYEEQVVYEVFDSRSDMFSDDEFAASVWTDTTLEHPSAVDWRTEVEAEDYRDAEALRWIEDGADLYIGWDGKPTF